MKCKIDEYCTVNSKIRKGYCSKHYRRLMAHGDPMAMKHRASVSHGLVKTPTWNSWRAMLERVRNPNIKQYKDYGGRGIKACERWSGDYGFINFYQDMGERPAGKTLDRIDNNGNYEPDNCKWSTYSEQCQNRRKRHLVKKESKNKEKQLCLK